MKYLMIIAFSLFASLFVSDGDDADYDKLWKEVESQENSLPKTAYDLVVKIYQLAKEEGQEDQLIKAILYKTCLLYTSPSPRDRQKSRMPSSA